MKITPAPNPTVVFDDPSDHHFMWKLIRPRQDEPINTDMLELLPSISQSLTLNEVKAIERKLSKVNFDDRDTRHAHTRILRMLHQAITVMQDVPQVPTPVAEAALVVRLDQETRDLMAWCGPFTDAPVMVEALTLTGVVQGATLVDEVIRELDAMLDREVAQGHFGVITASQVKHIIATLEAARTAVNPN